MKDALVCMTNDPSNADEFQQMQEEVEKHEKKAYSRQLKIARGRGAAKRHAKKAGDQGQGPDASAQAGKQTAAGHAEGGRLRRGCRPQAAQGRPSRANLLPFAT